jgi:class 3 adenylate cyclase
MPRTITKTNGSEDQIRILDELVRVGGMLADELDFKSLVAVLVEQSLDVSRSDLGAFYVRTTLEARRRADLRLHYRRGRLAIPERLAADSALVEFAEECDEAIVLLERKDSPFLGLLLHESMSSGIALPLATPKARIGLLVLNSRKPLHYRRARLEFLEAFARLAAGMLHNSRLFLDLRETLRRVEGLERYQKSIFDSMTNLLLTTDEKGRLKYFNGAAGARFGLTEGQLSRPFEENVGKGVGRRILRAIDRVAEDGREVLGMEGIYRRGSSEMDFALNASPLRTPRGRHEGVTLLFTDQSRERELQGQFEKVVEERRLIKDMFSRYLSAEIVARLVERPGLVKPGGDKKEATIFFADIRGYTAFAEGKDPEYIIDVLNAYFREAVEVVVRHRGYIDKFIGDAIMAAWGVPLQTAEQDARQAVAAALELQELVTSRKRKFFTAEAKGLRIGIGLHTGPIVAGNLGSRRRMNYTVIGDTVNVAARLEGVAGPDEVIITESTRQHLGEDFRLERRDPVLVKGKTDPIAIYRVTTRAGSKS